MRGLKQMKKIIQRSQEDHRSVASNTSTKEFTVQILDQKVRDGESASIGSQV